jgi:ABC-type branched-subunit amino acid transport system substrate-binding protein
MKQFAERGMDKAGIRHIGPGDIADDELLLNMGDAMLGTITAHFYSAAYPSAMNKVFVAAFQKDQGVRPNFMVVSGYDGMLLIYDACARVMVLPTATDTASSIATAILCFPNAMTASVRTTNILARDHS